MIKEHMQDQAVDYGSLKLLAVGGSGVVYAIDEERILKEFHGEEIDVERRALERLGLHVNIERLKIIDFEGSSIDGEDAGACYEWFSYKESSPRISRKTDIFAFGCAMYEVITGRQPYDELHPFEDRMIRVKKLYAENQFPEVENIPLGKLMQACWDGTFDSMDEVLQELGASLVAIRKVNPGEWDVKAVFFNALRALRIC
ncbi:SPS1 Serine-threonine protein kinase [Pyrenophora tritici-repentis]|nr:SPS1 Serine-threonine protein kinase [Pyrenophora tritici-repentis]KAI0571712.1 SPS1 Serine-threonine protein kinase [Pyrenophora tritici-repentis]KAI0605164.1 SPS1 Serine-threonine protein kinase [Pyrenophora tritici-repentis]